MSLWLSFRCLPHAPPRLLYNKNKMPKKYYNKSNKIQKIAKARINILFKLAKENFKKDSKLSDKYIKMARRIAMKYKIRLPSQFKKMFCKHCHKYLVPGVNCRVRIHKHRIIYYCFGCKHYIRHPIKWQLFTILKIILPNISKRKLYI